jgi:hypothetical protein
MEPRAWINKNIKELKSKFVGKTIIVCDNKVVKIFDGLINPLKINEVAREICKDKWCYTYFQENEEEYLL